MIIHKKHDEIEARINTLGTKSCILLAIMGMARTAKLLKHVSTHEQFKNLEGFDKFILGGLNKLLHNDLSIEKEHNKGLKTCNLLIPALEDYGYEDCVNQQDENLMSLAYSLTREWYYFIGRILFNESDSDCKTMGIFLLTPLDLIYEYICNKYDLSSYRSRELEINVNPLIKNEIDYIDSDIAFVSEKINLKDEQIEKRVKYYIQYKFWNDDE